MKQKNLIIICITAIICIGIISATIIMTTNNNSKTNNTTNITINDTNTTNNTTTSTGTTTKKSSKTESSEREEDQITADGWNPKEHEVNREYVGDGIERVDYDDGYHRWVNKKGDILSYGY